MLIFKEFNPNKHDSHKVADLIYSVDSKTYNKIFNSKKKAVSALEKAIISEFNYSLYNNNNNNNIDSNSANNSFTNNNNFNRLYLIFDDNKSVLGIIRIVIGKKSSLISDVCFAFKYLGISDAIKLSIIYFLDYLVLAKVNPNDIYVAEIAVDEIHRNKGLGTKIIKKVIEKSKEKKYKRIVLDAELKNKGAIKLYESLGFKIFNKKTFKIFKKERGMYNMEFIL